MHLLIGQPNGMLDMCVARKALCNTSHAHAYTWHAHRVTSLHPFQVGLQTCGAECCVAKDAAAFGFV